MAFRHLVPVKIWMQHKDQLTKMVLGPYCVPHTSNKLMCCNAFISLKNFSKEELKRNFEFYESFTVHESSLSPCVHSIQAASLDKMDMAYTFTNIRLDLDDYNKEVEEGCHNLYGWNMDEYCGRFGGMRVKKTS
jgi:trehalose/maltose hydrolase-like predicted phosphorylase